jgi:hypothetical protein
MGDWMFSYTPCKLRYWTELSGQFPARAFYFWGKTPRYTSDRILSVLRSSLDMTGEREITVPAGN